MNEAAPKDKPAGQRMSPTDRISYSAIAERAPLRLPNNARMAVWVIVRSGPGMTHGSSVNRMT